MPTRTCPFCESETFETVCASCGRDISATRRICANCSKMTPTVEKVCCHCGTPIANELAWKIPLIVFMFVVAFVVSFLIAVYD